MYGVEVRYDLSRTALVLFVGWRWNTSSFVGGDWLMDGGFDVAFGMCAAVEGIEV